jgi:DNA-binding transcriptional LysR family regulator
MATPPTPAISLRHMRFVVTLAEESHFSRAAQRLAISQPALSAAIRQVESQLGVRIFERTTHHVALTEAGAALLPHARRMITTAHNALEDMVAAAARSTSLARLGVIPSMMAPVSQCVAELGTSLPALRISLKDGRSEELLAGLESGAFDYVIGHFGHVGASMTAHPIAADHMQAMMRADHPCAGQPLINWQALQGCQIVHFTGGSIGEIATVALREAGLKRSDIYEVYHLDSLLGLVLSGLAVGLIPTLYTRLLWHADLAFVRIDQPRFSRQISLLHRRHLADEHPAVAALATPLRAGLAKVLGTP